MTRFFEVMNRDGAARIGRLLIKGGIETPYIERPQSVDHVIVNGGSSLLHGPIAGSKDTFTVQPYMGLSYYVKSDLAKIYEPTKVLEKSEYPLGVVVHPDWDVQGADMYVMAGARSLESDSRALLDNIIKIKGTTKADTALYVPALATPENVAMLIYLGVDVIDDVMVTARSFQGFYLTQDGEYKISDLSDLPCSCEVCRAQTAEGLRSLPEKERFETLAKHNYLRLLEEVRRVKVHIRNGALREYVEKQCRSRPWLTALLRLADAEFSYIEQRTPTYRSSQMLACSAESQNRVEVRRFAERVKTRFKSEGDILLIIPCSARKPYSMSKSHMAITRALGKYRSFVRELILTSPMGVVPRELELVYPAAHYDVAVTGIWDLEERQWVSNCLKEYLDTHHFKHVIAHVEGPYVDVCKQTGHDMVYTSKGRVISDASLDSLMEELHRAVNELSPRARGQKQAMIDMIRGMADYEFGPGKGELLVPSSAVVKGRFPRYIVFDGNKQLCSLNSEYGSLSLTLDGARNMDLGPDYTVEIGDFVPKGSILAPGVIGANLQIRPGDDVLVKGPNAIGIGKAKMSGFEMVESTRGMAVELRHVERLP